VSEYLWRLVEGVTPVPHDNLIEIRRDAAPRYYSINIKDVIGSSGERTGRVILFMDRTEAKNLEMLRESFLSVAAHELRTPITIMSTYLSFIGKMHDDREMLDAAYNDMLMANRRMKYIVNGIVNFISLYSRKTSTYREVIDVGSIISQGTEMFMSEAKEKNITFEVSDIPPLSFYSHPDLFTIAVQNIIGNAIKFNSENCTVHIDVGSCEIKGEPGLSIGVSNGGERLPENFPDDLINSLQQGELPLVRVHDGLAIGLFIAQRAAKLAYGTLRAESLPEGKSRFVLEFPLGKPETVAGQ
jgi:signal transduction histidine kinase